MATSSHTANSPVSFSSKRNGSRLLERCTQTGSGACDNEGTGTTPREGSRAAVPEGQVAARPDAPTPAADFSNGAVPAAPPARSHDFAVLRDLALHGTLLHTALLNPFKNFMAAYKCRKLFMVLRGQALPPPLQQRMSSPPPPTCDKRFHTWAGGGGVCDKGQGLNLSD